MPAPLTLEEEAALAFAACGITGRALGELPYQTGNVADAGGGNIMGSFVGRTVASGDALHATSVIVINDEGAWFLKRPHDFDSSQIDALIQAAREERLVEIYEKMRVKIADGRVTVPREVPYCPPFNKWSANIPGSTYFLPVIEYTALYINMLLAAFSPDIGMFLLDERNGFKPAGIGQFAKSKGGHLDDTSPADGSPPTNVGTIGFIESALFQLAGLEEGAMLQNLALMAQALGLGGFPHAAEHPKWLEALGFRVLGVPFSKVFGLGVLETLAARLLHKDVPVPTAVGLERDGVTLLSTYCPPYYSKMEDAVRAFVATKFGKGKGIYRDHGRDAPFLDGAKAEAAVPNYSEEAIAATVAYCSYVHDRFGRFPAGNAPLATLLAYQAHRLDTTFYDQFYPPEALSETQRQREETP
ncbi:MAG: hypothetical protein U0271_02800 [Polyangiaceae bacterium]